MVYSCIIITQRFTIHNTFQLNMECLPGFLFSRELLLALVLHGDHHHVGLVDQVGGRGEHCRGLALLKDKIQSFQWSIYTIHNANINHGDIKSTLKYSLRVLENFLLYFTNSRFLCSSACLP